MASYTYADWCYAGVVLICNINNTMLCLITSSCSVTIYYIWTNTRYENEYTYHPSIEHNLVLNPSNEIVIIRNDGQLAR